ncbi:MAG TPA: helix-turn-helix transcriptional regulator [Solirubrobacteraceae bacterium]|nr:helix-turn-helix transcriptional regulator [Solirubrobacteraceae bacterium]
MSRARIYSPQAVEAAQLLGARIRLARRERRWSVRELAERASVTPFTLSKVERGDMTVGLGVAFELAALTGVALFHEDRSRLSGELERTSNRLALLPQRVRAPAENLRDDF